MCHKLSLNPLVQDIVRLTLPRSCSINQVWTSLLSLPCVSLSADISGLVLWCLLSPLSCPLNPQLVEADGCPSWFWWRFITVKREFFSLHSRLVHAQDGALDQIEVALQSRSELVDSNARLRQMVFQYQCRFINSKVWYTGRQEKKGRSTKSAGKILGQKTWNEVK